jgi:hypothetical protein
MAASSAALGAILCLPFRPQLQDRALGQARGLPDQGPEHRLEVAADEALQVKAGWVRERRW